MPLALITGASAGIGAAFARRLSKDGYRVILVARRHDRLQALAKELGNAEVLVADIATDDGLKIVADRVAAAPSLDLLVNNAGFGTEGRFFEIPLESQDRMHRLHILATLRLTHAALPAMVARRSGGVINVSSVAAFGQSPGNTSYCATKTWMNSFTRGLSIELKGIGSPVKVQALCPGFTITELHDVLGMDRSTIAPWLWMTAEHVVDDSLRALERGKLFVVPGGIYKLAVALQRWVPWRLQDRLVRRGSPHFSRKLPPN